jgi:prolyl-tRNA editing enzyme YbaK/EbsC (Cys-tRNA(Pro) deacylase)
VNKEPSTKVRIHQPLNDHNVSFRTLHHEPTRTSADSARVRGEDLAIGARAIVMKVGDVFRLFVLCANMKLNAKAIKEYFKAQGVRAKRIRFATE